MKNKLGIIFCLVILLFSCIINSETQDLNNIIMDIQNNENIFVSFDAKVILNELISFLGNYPPSYFKLGDYDDYLKDNLYFNRNAYGHLIELSKKLPNSRYFSDFVQSGSISINYDTIDEANNWLSMFRDILIEDKNWKNKNLSGYDNFYDIYENNNIYITFQKPIHSKKEFIDSGKYFSIIYFSIGPKIYFR